MAVRRLEHKRHKGPFVFQAFDAAYLERLRIGDPETERHFVRYFGDLIMIKLRRRLRSRPLIDDVRQETFLRVLRALRRPEGIRNPESLGAFVNSVCNNVMLELLRAEGRYHPTPDQADRAMDPDGEARLISEERKELVRRVIQSLPHKDQQLLRALFLEERDKDAICAEFGVNRDYFRVLLHRAKVHFRALYIERQRPRPPAVASQETHCAPRRSLGRSRKTDSSGPRSGSGSPRRGRRTRAGAPPPERRPDSGHHRRTRTGRPIQASRWRRNPRSRRRRTHAWLPVRRGGPAPWGARRAPAARGRGPAGGRSRCWPRSRGPAHLEAAPSRAVQGAGCGRDAGLGRGPGGCGQEDPRSLEAFGPQACPWLHHPRAQGPGRATIVGSETTTRLIASAFPDGRRLRSVTSRVDYRMCPGLRTCGNDNEGQAGDWIPVLENKATGSAVRIRPLCSEHSPQYLGLTLWRGCAHEDRPRLPSRPSEWVLGDTLAYLIDFLQNGRPVFRVYYQDSATNPTRGYVNPQLIQERQVDLALLCAGAFNQVRRNPEGILESTRPRHILLGHWDDFFTPLTEEVGSLPAHDFRILIRSLKRATGAEPFEGSYWLPAPGSAFVFSAQP